MQRYIVIASDDKSKYFIEDSKQNQHIGWCKSQFMAEHVAKKMNNYVENTRQDSEKTVQ